MKIIGTKNKFPVSWYARVILKSRSSHVAFVFDEKLLIHSSIPSGINLQWFSKFLKHNQKVWEIDVPLPLEQEESIYQDLLDEHSDEGYDYWGAIYLGWRGLLYRLFKKPYPTLNKWGSNKRPMCMGVFLRLPKWLVGVIDERKIEIMSPDQVGEYISETTGREITWL